MPRHYQRQSPQRSITLIGGFANWQLRRWTVRCRCPVRRKHQNLTNFFAVCRHTPPHQLVDLNKCLQLVLPVTFQYDIYQNLFQLLSRHNWARVSRQQLVTRNRFSASYNQSQASVFQAISLLEPSRESQFYPFNVINSKQLLTFSRIQSFSMRARKLST